MRRGVQFSAVVSFCLSVACSPAWVPPATDISSRGSLAVEVRVMGDSADFFIELGRRITVSRPGEARDELLDQWYDRAFRATDWDAWYWGFNPDTWMSKERDTMEGRAERDDRHRSWRLLGG